MAALSVLCISADKPDFIMDAWRCYCVPGFIMQDVISVSDMVTKLQRRCTGGRQIGELWIVGHGGARGQYIGADALTAENVDKFEPELSRVTPLFDHWATPPPLVTMCGCHVGHAAKLLLALQSIFHVSVRGFTGIQSPMVVCGQMPRRFKGREEMVEPLRSGSASSGH
jgi:hypothetical protein